MSTSKGVYRGRNVDDGSSGSLAGRAPLPEDRQLDDRSSYPTASTSGTSKPKGNYNPPSSRANDAGRRNDDRPRGRWDDRDRDRTRDRDHDRDRGDRDHRAVREDKFAKQRAPPVAVVGKGDYRREDREAKAGASPAAGSRRPRDAEDSNTSNYNGRENGTRDYGASASGVRGGGDDWQSKRPRLDDSTSETSSFRRFDDSQGSQNNNNPNQSNSKGKGVYVRNEARDKDGPSTERPAGKKVWPPPGWDEEKDQRRKDQKQRDVIKTKGTVNRSYKSTTLPSPERDGRGGTRTQDSFRGRDSERGHDRSRRSSRSPSRSRSRSPGAASSLRTGRSPSPTSSTRSGRTGQTLSHLFKGPGQWERPRIDNTYPRHRSRSRSASPVHGRNDPGRNFDRRRSPSPQGRRRGRSSSPNGNHNHPRPVSPGGYDPSRPSNIPFEHPPPIANQWPPHGQAGFPGLPPPDQQHHHQMQAQHSQQPPHQYPQHQPLHSPHPNSTQQHYQPTLHQHPPPLPAWPPQPPIHVDPRHFPMPPALSNGPPPPIPPPAQYIPSDSFLPRDSYAQHEGYQAHRRESFPTPDMFPQPHFQNNQYPPLPGQFPPLPNQFPPGPHQQPPHSAPPNMYPPPYPPPTQSLHEGPSAADRNLSISFRSPPIGMSQSPPGSMQGLPERQLSLGIRAPPPGPNKGGGGKFKPIAGFVTIGSATPPVNRGQLGRFFPGDDPQDDFQQQRPPSAQNQQASPALRQVEEQQTSAWARWEAPTATQQQDNQGSQGMARSSSNTMQAPQQQQQEQQQQQQYQYQQQQQLQPPPFTALPTAHAPVFPGLLPSLPALPPQANGRPAEPPSPSQANAPPINLPSKPNFAGSLLPAFLPNKPATTPAIANTSAAQANLPTPPVSLPSLASITASSSIPLPQRQGLPPALAKFIPGAAQVSALRAEKTVETLEEVSAATPQGQAEATPQTPLQGTSTEGRSPVKDPSQSVQPSPAPSEVGNNKQTESASQAPAEAPSAQEQAASQAMPKIVNSELYERLAQVGEGTYGKVYKARRQDTGKLVALKRIRMEAEKDGFPVTAIREIKLLQSLDHPNILKLMEMMVSKGHVYMVSEYLEHDLTGILNNPSMQVENRNFTDANLKSLMKQLLQGLDYIHWRGVLHRDLKGSNILLGKNGDLKIADFGLAKFYDKNARNDYTNRVITLWYKPPELLFGETVYGPEVDMWSAGCIFLELFTKKPVFQGQDELHQLDVIFRYMGTPDPATWPEVTTLPWYELVKPKHTAPSIFRETFYGNYIKSELGIQLAELLLSFNPKNRPSAKEALQHAYFTSDVEEKDDKPTWLADIKGDWHEMESKEANKKKGREARKAAAVAAQAQAQSQAQV